jgi:hypothetical protein
MTPYVTALIEAANKEWIFFGYSRYTLQSKSSISGVESAPPYTQRITDYWAVVGHPHWDGKTSKPWSAAFISWCFKSAGNAHAFPGSAQHSVYIDAIRRNRAPGLVLVEPSRASLKVGDLIWMSRKSQETPNPPKSYQDAVTRLQAGEMFSSHVDIVVETRPGEIDSIGGNVQDSITKSTWRTNAAGNIVDLRRTWIGVVQNGW